MAAICKQDPPDVSKHRMCHCTQLMHTSSCVVAMGLLSLTGTCEVISLMPLQPFLGHAT